MTEDEPGRPKGYMLAALARSHKGGIGSLPEITDIYLKDASFSGYRPEFILREMFERGIFGFIPAIMLERYRINTELNVGSRQTDQGHRPGCGTDRGSIPPGREFAGTFKRNRQRHTAGRPCPDAPEDCERQCQVPPG